jgi:hypothetical protein
MAILGALSEIFAFEYNKTPVEMEDGNRYSPSGPVGRMHPSTSGLKFSKIQETRVKTRLG